MAWDGVDRRKLIIKIPGRRKVEDRVYPLLRYALAILIGIAGTLERDNSRLRELATKDAITRTEAHKDMDEKLAPIYTKLNIIDSGVSQMLGQYDEIRKKLQKIANRPDVVWVHKSK